MTFSLNINTTGTGSTNFTNMLYSLYSSAGGPYYAENDNHLFTIVGNSNSQHTRSCVVNNVGTNNFTLSITPTYTTSATSVTWMSLSSVYPTTFLQFTKIG